MFASGYCRCICVFWRSAFESDTICTVSRDRSWDIRDTHMKDVLMDLMQHHKSRVDNPKCVVWAHNSHLGDARARGPGPNGKLNLGQLVREEFSIEDTLTIGFTTDTGTVSASDHWGTCIDYL